MLKPIFIWHKKKLRRIHPEDVYCLDIVGNYTRIFLKDNSYWMVRSSLTSAQKKLPQDMFIKIHRALVVSIYYIDQIDRDHLLVHDQSVPIGKQYYKSLIRKLNIIE